MKLNRKLFQFIRSKFWPGGVRFTIISWACDRTYFNTLWTRSFRMEIGRHQHTAIVSIALHTHTHQQTESKTEQKGRAWQNPKPTNDKSRRKKNMFFALVFFCINRSGKIYHLHSVLVSVDQHELFKFHFSFFFLLFGRIFTQKKKLH